MHPALLSESELLNACDVKQMRRGGPGGQRRNKVETAVVITHKATGIRAEASERRSRAENLAKAVFRLRLNMAVSVRGEADAASSVWQTRCASGRLSINPSHRDYPAMLAIALDAIADQRYDMSEAATVLGCTPSQLLKLVKLEPKAFQQLNQARADHGFHPMK
ncbi:MAG: peptide chain release factor-like protein [Pirellulales bacterium]|nr:peptide chain release factor-like protein [Pirellulales bacterium]